MSAANAPIARREDGQLLAVARNLGKSYPKVFRPRDRLRALGKLLVGIDDIDSVPVLRAVDLDV
ncbi:MAG: hypothetical protein JSS42_02585, partial [Proteobacteria bacterium]|nr:hypothetical protein [Pseudomonadota bacterium]